MIESLEPHKSYKLDIGDIFFGEELFINGVYKSKKRDIVEVGFLTEKLCEKSEKILDTMISKGKMFQFEREIQFKKIDSSRANAIWCVENINYQKEFRGLHGVRPESLLITARRLKDNNYDEDGEVIEFYTLGGKATIDIKFEIIGKIKKD